MKAITEYDITTENEVRIWKTIVQKVIVYPGHLLEFHMIDGSKIEYRMYRTSPRLSKPTACAKEDICNDYVNGYRIDFLAQKYGFSIKTIKRIIEQVLDNISYNWLLRKY